MKAAPVNPAAASTNPALVHLLTLGATVLAPAPQLINMLAPAPATPAAPAPLAAENIPPAPAPAVTSGKSELARNKRKTALKEICIIAMAKLLVYVLREWTSMSR